MAISLSLAVLLGVVVLLKQGYVHVGSALACSLFGFTLASTGLAPVISGGLASRTGFISGI